MHESAEENDERCACLEDSSGDDGGTSGVDLVDDRSGEKENSDDKSAYY